MNFNLYKIALVFGFFLMLPSTAMEQTLEHERPLTTDSKAPIDFSLFESINQLGELQLNLPKSHYFMTDGGVPAVFTPMHHLPIVDLDIVFEVGSYHDELIRQGAEDIAKMTAMMMLQGTDTLDDEAFGEKAEGLAMALSFQADTEAFAISLRALTDNDTLENAVVMLLDAYANPRFDETILARNKAQAAVAVQMAKENPAFLAQLALAGIVNKNDPKAYDDIPLAIDKITRDELLAYKNRFLVAQNAKIAITGALSLDEAKTLANRLAAGLTQGKKAPPIRRANTPKPIHYHIDYPSEQTYVLIGAVTPTYRTDKAGVQQLSDFYVGGAILHAGLMEVIREQNGYTYGIDSDILFDKEQGVYYLSFSTQNQLATQAIADTMTFVQDYLTLGPPKEDLVGEIHGKKYAYPVLFATHTDVHQQVLDMFFGGHAKDHLQTYLTRLDNATVESVNQALNYFISPKHFIVITVGKTKPKVVLPKDK